MDFTITDEQRAVVDTVRKVCQKKYLILKDYGMRRLLSAFNVQRCPNPAICPGISEGALEAAVQVHGSYGFTDEFPVSRFFRGTRYGSLGDGTSETLRNLVSRKFVDRMDLASGVFSLRQFKNIV